MDEPQDITPYALWKSEITAYEEDAEKWDDRGKKILRRYRDERNARQRTSARFNILWSNVQTLLPAVYNSPPKPNIERRFKDDDDIGRVASDVLERCVSYFIDTEKFDSVIKQCVQDRLLPGRGTGWVRYDPKFKSTGEITDDDEAPQEELDYEEVCVDYVHWQDFGHTVAKTWEECRAVWRRAYLTRQQLIKRFGEEIGKEVPLDYAPKKLNDERMKEVVNKATVYEIWDKESQKVYWLSKDHRELLDEREDPLKLKDFFPCPKPVYATLTNDSLIPIPDYYLYQDQADELDELTSRIAAITKAIKVAGVYDASAQGVQRLLSEGVENTLIPIEKWAVFGEKGGLKGVMDLLPMQDIAQTLLNLYDARDKVKADLYEITGMSDIIRGSTDPDETYGAQKMKGQFGTLRISPTQKDVARFCRDFVQIIAEIVAEQFSIETIKKISGVHLLSNQEKQMMMQQQAMKVPPAGQPPAPPPPMEEDQQELIDAPSWEDIDGLLKNQQIRCYRIDIETDSTIKADQEAEQQARVQFLTAAGGFIKEATQVQNPELQPLLMEMLMFGVRGFKAGRELEGEFKETMTKLKKAAANPPPPQPDPEQMKMQQSQQQHEQEMQAEAAQHQQEMQQRAQEQHNQALIEQHRNELEAQRAQQEMQHDAMLQNQKVESDRELAKYKADLDAANAEKLAILNYQLDSQKLDAQVTMKQAETGYMDPKPVIDGIMQQLTGMANVITDAHQKLAIAHATPRVITLDNGRSATVAPLA